MDTGRAGTIYGQSIDQILGKSYFAKHSLLPRDYKLEALHTFPAPDFQNLGAGSWARDKSIGYYTASSASRGNVGWNFGANKGKALFVLSNFHAIANRGVIFINDGQPNTAEVAGAKGIGFYWDAGGTNFFETGKIDSANGWNNTAGWTQLIRATAALYAPAVGQPHGMALYVDTAGAGVVKAFLRLGFHEWIEVISGASNHLAAVRCATILYSPSGANTMVAGAPFGIFAE